MAENSVGLLNVITAYTYPAAVLLSKIEVTSWAYGPPSPLCSSKMPESSRILRLGSGRPAIAALTMDEMVVSMIDVHEQNVNRSGSNTQSSQTLRATSPELQTTSRCSQTPLELCKVLSDSARAFSGAPESTWRYGGAFRMLQDFTYRIVRFWGS